MNDAPPLPATPPVPAKSKGLQALGIAFIALWLVAHGFWAVMAFAANAMANDSGAAAASSQLTLIIGMLIGQALCALAGIPASLAFFKQDQRAKLLTWFAVLFVIGALIQGVVFYAFFAPIS